MTDATLVAAGTQLERAAEASTDIPYHDVAAGRVAVIYGSCNSSNAANVTTPAGWTQIVAMSRSSNTVAPSLYAAYKVLTGSETGNVTVAHSNSVSMWQMTVLASVDTTTVLDVAVQTFDSGASNVSQTTFSGVTVVTAGSFGLVIAANNGTGGASTPPAGWTEIADRATGTRNFTAAYKASLPAGATGSIHNDWSSAAGTIGALIVFRAGSATAAKVWKRWNGGAWVDADMERLTA